MELELCKEEVLSKEFARKRIDDFSEEDSVSLTSSSRLLEWMFLMLGRDCESEVDALMLEWQFKVPGVTGMRRFKWAAHKPTGSAAACVFPTKKYISGVPRHKIDKQ